MLIYYVFTSIEHDNAPTARDYELSNVGTKAIMKSQGKWTFDANYGGDPFASRCSQQMGHISTKFEGYGVGKLMYGNCGKGRVDVKLNDQRIDFIEADTPFKTVNFHFSPFDKLELEEIDSEAVIDLISLDVGPTGNLCDVKLYS